MARYAEGQVVRFIYRHASKENRRACGDRVHRVAYTVHRKDGEIGGWEYRRADGTAAPIGRVSFAPVSPCPSCGKPTKGSEVVGRVVEDVKCNAICQSAKYGSCDCSCGGANHGGAHDCA